MWSIRVIWKAHHLKVWKSWLKSIIYQVVIQTYISLVAERRKLLVCGWRYEQLSSMSIKLPFKNITAEIPVSAKWYINGCKASCTDVLWCLPNGTQMLREYQCGRRDIMNTLASQVYTAHMLSNIFTTYYVWNSYSNKKISDIHWQNPI